MPAATPAISAAPRGRRPRRREGPRRRRGCLRARTASSCAQPPVTTMRRCGPAMSSVARSSPRPRPSRRRSLPARCAPPARRWVGAAGGARANAARARAREPRPERWRARLRPARDAPPGRSRAVETSCRARPDGPGEQRLAALGYVEPTVTPAATLRRPPPVPGAARLHGRAPRPCHRSRARRRGDHAHPGPGAEVVVAGDGEGGAP